MPGFVPKQVLRVNWAWKSVLDGSQTCRKSLEKVMAWKKCFRFLAITFFRDIIELWNLAQTFFWTWFTLRKLFQAYPGTFWTWKFLTPKKCVTPSLFPEKCQHFPMILDIKIFCSQTVLLPYLNDLLVHNDPFQCSTSYIRNFMSSYGVFAFYSFY